MSAEEKPFEATPARRERAKHEGNVPRSAELAGIAAFAAGVLAAFVAVRLLAGGALSALAQQSAHPLAGEVPRGLAVVAPAAALPAMAAAGAAIAAGLAQAGGLRVNGVKLDLSRLSPGAGLKRMFGGEALIALARGTLAFAAALLALVPLGRETFAAATAFAPPASAASIVAFAVLRACGLTIAVGAAFAFADYAFARKRWLRSIRMSFEELKRDARETEGDPQAKSRRKQLHRSVSRGAIARTREASFVVVNPTHVAVAVKYAPPRVPVPEILVRAVDEAALRVKELARLHAVPIVADVALARLLYATGETGRAIPAPTFVAVAQILAALAGEGLLA